MHLQVLVLDLLPRLWYIAALPASTVQSCMPYWLEAGAWLLGLMSDGTAAAMGRLPATQREGPPRSHIDRSVGWLYDRALVHKLPRLRIRIGFRVARSTAAYRTVC